MTNASPTNNAESVDISTVPEARFQTASEFLNREQSEDTDREADAPALAKTIIWYDQATPLFVCTEHHDDAAPLRHEGDEQANDPDKVRGEAYVELFEETPTCDICSNSLPFKVNL